MTRRESTSRRARLEGRLLLLLLVLVQLPWRWRRLWRISIWRASERTRGCHGRKRKASRRTATTTSNHRHRASGGRRRSRDRHSCTAWKRPWQVGHGIQCASQFHSGSELQIACLTSRSILDRKVQMWRKYYTVVLRNIYNVVYIYLYYLYRIIDTHIYFSRPLLQDQSNRSFIYFYILYLYLNLHLYLYTLLISNDDR